mgnify:CR=1 FL=1
MSEQGTNQIQQLQVPPAQNFDTANFQGSMQEVLHENIGKYVLVDFLIGTSNLVKASCTTSARSSSSSMTA